MKSMPILKIKKLATYIKLVTDVYERSGLKKSTSQLWYRGQDDRFWDLKPSIYRNKNNIHYEREMIRDFKLHSSELLANKPSNELEWLFLMQHYGIPTRLLDWSESHLIALYFSVLNYANTSDSAVWIIDPWSLNNFSLEQKTIPTSSHPDLKKYILDEPHLINSKINGIYPVAVRPTRNSKRIVAQKGTFTIHGNDTRALNKIFEEYNEESEELGKMEDRILLQTLTIDGKSKKNILKELFFAGISYSVIFPEIQGICTDITIRYSDVFY